MNSEKISIGILAYQGAKYFDFLIPSILAQDYPNLEILILDNASPENDFEKIRIKWPEVRIFRNTENLGFAEGHNFLIRKMSGTYYLSLNQDVFLESDFVSKLMEGIIKSSKIGAVSGKLYHWDFNNGLGGKTEIIDTVGIEAFASHRFIDRGQGEKDVGQYDQEGEIFAPSAAAALYRLEALEDVAYIQKNSSKEYFDRLFFMYKEDIDLGYRLRWAGWKAVSVSEAIGYHDRTVAQKRPGILGMLSERKGKSFQVRYLSWLNHQLLLYKNFSPGFSWRIKLKAFLYKFFTSGFILFFEPDLFFKARKNLAILKTKMHHRIPKRVVKAHEIERLLR